MYHSWSPRHSRFFAIPLAGIISGLGIICGPIWGSFVVLGSFAGRDHLRGRTDARNGRRCRETCSRDLRLTPNRYAHVITFLHVPARKRRRCLIPYDLHKIIASRHFILVRPITSHRSSGKEMLSKFFSLYHVALLSNNQSERSTTDHEKRMGKTQAGRTEPHTSRRNVLTCV